MAQQQGRNTAQLSRSSVQFNQHADFCTACQSPVTTYNASKSLCLTGKALADPIRRAFIDAQSNLEAKWQAAADSLEVEVPGITGPAAGIIKIMNSRRSRRILDKASTDYIGSYTYSSNSPTSSNFSSTASNASSDNSYDMGYGQHYSYTPRSTFPIESQYRMPQPSSSSTPYATSPYAGVYPQPTRRDKHVHWS